MFYYKYIDKFPVTISLLIHSIILLLLLLVIMIVIKLIILLLLYVHVYCYVINRDSNSNNSIDVNLNMNININKNSRQLLEDTAISSTEIKVNSIVEKEQKPIEKEVDQTPIVRTATGGFIHTIMVFLTIVSFIGNGAFMVYVFWLSR